MRQFTLLFVFAFIINIHFVAAQNSSVLIEGQIIEGSTNQPIGYATVMVLDRESSEMITGTTTDEEGKFSLEVPSPRVMVEISFIGFAKRTISDISPENGVANLGTILLSEDSQTLEEVVVRAEKSQTEFKLDKRVFNVGQDLSSTGASAYEVLNNVPSVNVNIEGQISLRGSTGVQILINGKPSVLASEEGNALGTITADMIERIEVITNPSAKYEAQGTSGIINIIIKKDDRKGINGSISANLGIPDNHSLGLSLNRRTEKFNLFSQLGAGYRELPMDTKYENRNKITSDKITSEGLEYRNETFYNVILGTDYHINDLNVLTLSGNFAYEVEDQPSEIDFTQLISDTQETNTWQRTEKTEATNPKWQYEFLYKKDFEDNKEHTFVFGAQGSFFGKDQESEFQNQTLSGSIPDSYQRTRTNFSEAKYTFQADYTQPFNEQWTLETGAQYVIQDVTNDFAVFDFSDDTWLINSDQTNIFDYKQNVLGVYATGSYEKNKWGVKGGLRVENTDLNTLLQNTNQTNQQNFNNLFPSLHTSYKASDRVSIQAGYSRRVDRPRLWDLNPFFNIRNNFTIRTGNPDLMPEFTDAYELNSIFIWDELSFNLGAYYRYTTDVRENVSRFEDNITISMPMNVGTNGSTGLEFNAKWTPAKWFTANADANYTHFTRKGELDEKSFDFTGSNWSSKLTSKFTLPKDFDLEVTGRYNSKYRTIQSEVSGNIYADLGLRKKVLDGKLVFNLSVRDIFASRFRESIIDNDNVYVYNYGRRGRFITLGMSYGFGKGEAMEYSGSRHH